VEYKIEYNKAVEFIGSMFKYATNKQQQASWNNKDLQEDVAKGMLDFSPSNDVKEWIKYVDNNISPFLRNDIVFIINKVFGLFDISFRLVLEENLKVPTELIESFKKLDSQRLIELTYYYYDSEIPLDSEDILIKNNLTELYNEEISSFFMQIKKHPIEYKNKIVEVFEAFYKLYYEPYQEKVYDFMEKQCENHNKLFKKDPISFLNAVGLGDYSKIIANENPLKIFVSFYIDLGIFYFSIDNTFIMFYGYTIEDRLDNKIIQDKYKALFKALSDDKRIEIIKITSKRPWYNKELADYFNLTTATLSYHLNLLLDLGILNFEPSINNRYYYTTNKENLKKLFDIALKDLLE
jgi:DNA-binding transcriptional ArsR family regulator